MKKKLPFLFSLAVTTLLLFTACQAKSSQTIEVNTPQEALDVLMSGNQRFVSETNLHPRVDMQRVQQTAPHQEPFAAVVCCSDSRVPAELIFDCGIGDIFVIRTAGNNVNSRAVRGSVDYAIGHLGVKLLLVLGHSSCGGVTGAVSMAAEEHESVATLLDIIRQDIGNYLGKNDQVDTAIRHHAQAQTQRILSDPHVQELVQTGKLMVKTAYYDVHTGQVSLLD